MKIIICQTIVLSFAVYGLYTVCKQIYSAITEDISGLSQISDVSDLSDISDLNSEQIKKRKRI